MTQLKKSYLWQRPDWPHFFWKSSELMEPLLKARALHGSALSHSLLLADSKPLSPLFADLYQAQKKPLTKERLQQWSSWINSDIRVKTLPSPGSQELKKFLAWWNEPPFGLDGMIRSAIALFWFALISPLEKNNFQVAISLAQLALAEDEKRGLKFYTLEDTILKDLESCFSVLEKLSQADGDLTDWIQWYLNLLIQLFTEQQTAIEKSVQNQLLWKNLNQFNLNARQKSILDHLQKNLPVNLITNRQCVALCKTSRESIKRDLHQLEDLQILKRAGRGRSVFYSLNISYCSV